MYIKEFYKNKKQNIHIIILFLIIIIVIYLCPNYFSKDGFTTTAPATTRPIPTLAQRVKYSLPTGKMIANIPETSRSYSSFFDDNNGKVLNKSTLDSITCWAPASGRNDTNQYINISLPSSNPSMVHGLVVMGRADNIYEYVTSFTVSYISELSGSPINVDNGIIFNSNLYSYKTPDGKEKSYILFANPVPASIIIIKPKTWSNSIAMRVDLLLQIVPQTTIYQALPIINGSISPPVVVPTIPLITGYISTNNDIKKSLNDSYDSIKNERNTNLDNQDRINNLEKRIKKIKLDIIGMSNSSNNTNIKKAPKFY